MRICLCLFIDNDINLKEFLLAKLALTIGSSSMNSEHMFVVQSRLMQKFLSHCRERVLGQHFGASC